MADSEFGWLGAAGWSLELIFSDCNDCEMAAFLSSVCEEGFAGSVGNSSDGDCWVVGLFER